ncbi:MAG: NAD(P)/FAD-dependent oxidoreductase [Nitrososphaeraceae archaeon]|nr:NAD(P)/FAD-dependent oxidoreductase [Nitrososphaeraceae archaeon]MBV9669095.1 NAD(P)/FAD-dependent oxidoreductase [Nitrososphaeraceae archaeon]
MAKAKQVLILGGGFGGLTSANLIRKGLQEEECQITVIDKHQYFMMGLVNLWILSGSRILEHSRVALNKLEAKGIRFLNDEITSIDHTENAITTKMNNNKLRYDYLIVALGSELAPKRIEGFEDNDECCFNVYDTQQIPSLRQRILALKSGRVVVCIADIPYKCPPAPYEISLLINDILIKNGTRESIDLSMYVPTPISLPAAGVKVSQDVVKLLNDNHIKFYPNHKLKRVSDKKTIEFENGNKTRYDLLILVPPHQLPQVIRNSGLLEDADQRWVNADRFTLRTKYSNVFAIGDVTEIRIDNAITVPKAGIFAEGEAKAVSQQIINEIKNSNDDKERTKFDGRGFCFMEIGDKKAGYIDVDLYNEAGPTTNLEPPSYEFYQKKLDFERSRLDEWLM